MRFFICLVFIASVSFSALAQDVGDLVLLESENSAGVPVHPADRDNSFVRWPNGTEAAVTAIGDWYEVEADSGERGWVTSRYISIVDETEPGGDEASADRTYRIGTWNIEHFKAGSTRGFPENRRGGPSYPQAERDVGYIAAVIRDELQVSILVLNEINGIRNGTQSNELDRLVADLGAEWEYVLSESGGTQRQAILHNRSHARREVCHEFRIPEERIQDKDISARDPLACQFILLGADGTDMNDLTVIALHLASGQRNNLNHNRAMEALESRFAGVFDGSPFPSGETDVLIAGDFNANRYDRRAENFWEDYGGAFDLDVLAPANGEDYPPTRLSGVPLRPGSKIDYIMASMGLRSELVLQVADVRDDVLIAPFEDFRRLASDHIPVTVDVRVVADDD